jgi:hypothetical protein
VRETKGADGIKKQCLDVVMVLTDLNYYYNTRARIIHPANNPTSKPIIAPVDGFEVVVVCDTVIVRAAVVFAANVVVAAVEFVPDLVVFAVVIAVAVEEVAADGTTVPPPAFSQGAITH